MASNENVIDDQPSQPVQATIKTFERKQGSAKQGAEFPRASRPIGQNTTRVVGKEPERCDIVQGMTKITAKSGFPNTSANPQKTCKVNMQRPVQFIVPEDGKLEVNPEAIAILKNIKDPVSVIAIIGKYRTGKSYIMNRIFDTNDGFALGGQIQACTKGIWFWARPHPLDPERTLILLDTEGLYDVELGDQSYDMKLFSLGLLLSNVLVYNAQGALDDVAIQQLNMVTELTNHLKTKERDDEEGEEHYSRYFPIFVMLLRDFFLKLELDGKSCEPNDYLENALKLKKGKGRSITDYNLPRECIREFFPRRMCHVLCRPVHDDEKLRNMEKVKDSEINPEFLEQAAKAIKDIVEAARKPFTVDLHPMNGRCYTELAEIYVETMNKDGIPCISNAMELMKNNACHEALKAAVALFEDKMFHETQGKMPLEEKVLIEKYEVAHFDAVKLYCKKAVLDDDREERMQELEKALEDCYRMYHENNRHASDKKCKEMLKECFRELQDNVKEGKYSKNGGSKNYKEDKEKAIQQYQDILNKGPRADYALSEWLENIKPQEDALINADKELSAKDKELAIKDEAEKLQKQKVLEAQKQNERLTDDLKRQEKKQQDMIFKLQQDFQERQDKFMQERDREIQEKEAEYRKLVDQGLTKQAEAHKILMEELKQDKKQQADRYEEQMKRLEAKEKDHQERMIALQKAHQEKENAFMKKLDENKKDMKDQYEKQLEWERKPYWKKMLDM